MVTDVGVGPAPEAWRAVLGDLVAALRREPASADVLAARCGLTPAAAAALIAELELAGQIVREVDGRLVPAG